MAGVMSHTHLPAAQAMEPLHNCRVKRYPDGSAEIVAAAGPFGGGEVRREPRRYDGDASSDPFRPKTAAEREADYELLEREAIQDEDGSEARARAERTARASRERAQRRAVET